MLTKEERRQRQREACLRCHRKHRVQRAAYAKAWRIANPEKAKLKNPYKAEWARKNYAKDPAKAKATQTAWRKANPEKIRMYYDRVNAKRHENIERHRENERAKARLRFFRSLGITALDYDRMFFEQEGRCWICRTEAATHKTSPEKRLVVDHDHVDGTIRGLLCQKCNKALGLFNDDLAVLVQAVHYLTKHAKEIAA